MTTLTTFQPTAYIAGPMRNLPEFNFPAFFEAEKALRAVGYRLVRGAEDETRS